MVRLRKALYFQAERPLVNDKMPALPTPDALMKNLTAQTEIDPVKHVISRLTAPAPLRMVKDIDTRR